MSRVTPLRLALTLLLGAVLLAAVPRAHACSCLARPFEELAADADAIFEARVAAVEPIEGSEPAMLRVRLDVVQTWREANAEHVEVRTASQSAACGVSFEVGRSYLVLADREGGELVASLCGGTVLMDDASEQRLALGSGVIPVDVEDDDPAEPSSDDDPAPRQTLAPRGGGCAGCAVSGTRGAPLALALAVLALLAIQRRRNRSARPLRSLPSARCARSRPGPPRRALQRRRIR